MKKTLLLLGLTAIVAVPSTGSAKILPLDIPPILAAGVKSTCTGNSDCTTSPNTFCCSGTCQATACSTCATNTDCTGNPNGTICCSGTCQATACPPPCTGNSDCTTSPNTFCCSGTCQATACPTNTCTGDGDCTNSTYGTHCCGGACQSPSCPAGALNDSGITTQKAANDDSQYGRDKTVPDPNPSDGQAGFSFTKITVNGKTCVQDNVTGLTWSPNLGPSTLDGLDTIIQQNDNLCGLTGWRMPTIKELVSIVSYHQISPAIDTAFFPNTANGKYWSSTPNAADGTKMWGVHFADGNASNDLFNDIDYRLRLVRP